MRRARRIRRPFHGVLGLLLVAALVAGCGGSDKTKQFGKRFEPVNEQLLVGEPSLAPRLTPVPVRMPLPPAEHQGSIYENQRASGRRYFETAPARVAAE